MRLFWVSGTWFNPSQRSFTAPKLCVSVIYSGTMIPFAFPNALNDSFRAACVENKRQQFSSTWLDDLIRAASHVRTLPDPFPADIA